jgi:glutamate-1-semialdehyde aminotransferase
MPYLYTPEGKRYLDFSGGLGSNLRRPNNNYTLPSTKEVVLAERLKEIFPFIDKLKFLKTGSEACQAAIRIARAHTKDNIVIGQGYHGWHNCFIASERPGAGCIYESYSKFPTLDMIIEYIKSNSKEKDPNRQCKIAAVIIEPVALNMHVREKLQLIRNLCTANKIVLIFDEIITGFRFPKYCVSNYFEIEPDLICFGKAMAGGYTLSVVGGKAKYMDTPDYFVSSTFAGEASALNEALSMLDFLSEEKLQELWDRGAWFQEQFNGISSNIELYGYPTRAVWEGEKGYKDAFWELMCERGYIVGKAHFLMFSHTKEILEKFLKDAREVIEFLDNNPYGLKGKPSQEVFKRN